MMKRMFNPRPAIAAAAVVVTTNIAFGAGALVNTLVGNDLNSAANPLVQPADDALSGGGRDQSLQFGDILEGGKGYDLLIGALGIDTLIGNDGNDVIVGGTEDFNPFNRDRAFGGKGDDAFIWAPGDGSDFFDGEDGADVLILGLLGESDGSYAPVFAVQNDQNFDPLFIDPNTGLPVVDVTNSPGFCDVVDGTDAASADELAALDLDQLVRFSIRAVADAFETGEQQDDNGLRVTIHLRDAEYLVCTTRDGGAIEVLNLTTTPPTPATVYDLPTNVQSMLR